MKCFADKAEDYCSALKEKECDGCPFFKTVAQAKKDRAKALQRIESLDLETRTYIYDKYFN